MIYRPQTEFRRPAIWYRILTRLDAESRLPASSEIGHGLLSYNTINGLIRVYTRRHSQMRESETRSCRIDNYREFSPAGLTNRNSRQPQTFRTPLMYHRHTYAISGARECALNTYMHGNTTKPLLIYPRRIFNNSLTAAREMPAPLCTRQPDLISTAGRCLNFYSLSSFFYRLVERNKEKLIENARFARSSYINHHYKTIQDIRVHYMSVIAIYQRYFNCRYFLNTIFFK